MLHNYTNIAVADICTQNFKYCYDSIRYHDMLLYYHDSGKILLSSCPNTDAEFSITFGDSHSWGTPRPIAWLNDAITCYFIKLSVYPLTIMK